ncbi:MAG: hypothetical protein RRY08_01035 [Christensenella sp.]
MKKGLLGAFIIALCSIFVFVGCAPAAPAGDDLVLAVSGTVSEIQTTDGNTSITVDGSEIDSQASYKLMVLNVSDKTPVVIDSKAENYTDGTLLIGDNVEVYLSPNTPVTASEPPMANPDKIVVTARANAATTDEVKTNFDGTITELAKDGDYLIAYIRNDIGGEATNDLRAVISSDTVITASDGNDVLTIDKLATGQKVTVTTDGRMTFSIPPQANAQSIIIKETAVK